MPLQNLIRHLIGSYICKTSKQDHHKNQHKKKLEKRTPVHRLCHQVIGMCLDFDSSCFFFFLIISKVVQNEQK